ncbi:hypothetical protein ACIRS1_35565 [Kitasatospora sp. NPDC101176]|uniref:hypothetical protein n=1 Tax=Kitasatospora sp. NPDC101176 TaxID=3364099 RepID=UPI0038079D45
MTAESRYEVRLIRPSSPHFLLLECWGLWDPARHAYLRVPGSSGRIRRFYTPTAAQTYLRTPPARPPDTMTA